MNIQVANLASATTIPVAALAASEHEPIISLIEAYEAGCKAYHASNDESDDFAQATYGVPFDQIIGGAWEIQTVVGAIAALRFAKKEEGYHLDSLATGPLVDAVLRFLESAAGVSLAHPDTELLALGAQIDALTTKIEENSAFHNSMIAECDRQFMNCPDALIIGRRDRDWFGDQVTRYGKHWHFDDAITVTTPRRVSVGTLSAAQARAEEIRQGGAAHKAAYEAWQERVGLTANEEEFEALAEQRSELFQAALAIRPATIDGAVIQAKIVRHENYSLFKARAEDEYDDGEKETVAFISNLLPMEG